VTIQPEPIPAPPPVLTLRHISKRFGGAVAVDDVSLAIRSGSVHAVLGENGAGKTTLMRVAFGLLQPDGGTVLVDGVTAHLRSPADAIALGIGMVHQHFTHVGAMTVAENVALGRAGRYDATRAAARVREIGERTGLVLDPHERAEDLAVGAQQRLEIVKALGRDARLLILDEPTAVLAPAESAELLRWLRSFADAGNSVVLITHKLQEALSISDDVTVLRRGRAVLSARASEVDATDLTVALLGEAPPLAARAEGVASDKIVAELKHVDAVDEQGLTKLRDVSLAIHAGEIVGVAAVEGSGQHELLRLLAARLEAEHGSVDVPTTVAFVPEDRHRDAVILDFSLVDNVALRGAGKRRGRIGWRKLVEHTNALITTFDVRGGKVDGATRQLSGGNQQKLVLARELDGEPSLVVAENPTRGLDIRATRDVHDRLRAAARHGAGVVVYSSDLDEVLSLATRIVVLHGAKLKVVDGDREAVGRAMLGVA